MTSPLRPPPQPPQRAGRRRWSLRRIGLIASAVVAGCLVVLILLPTPLVESTANAQGSRVVKCGRLRGLSVHLQSWPVIGRVLFGASLRASGHIDEVTTKTYSVHDVSFAARSVNVNRSALVGGDVSVPIRIELTWTKVAVTVPVPIVGRVQLLVSPPAGIALEKLTISAGGLHVGASMSTASTESVLCKDLTGARTS